MAPGKSADTSRESSWSTVGCIEYTISTPTTVDVGLGFSVRKAGSQGWVSDTGNDVVVNVGSGIGIHSREFVLPLSQSTGEHDVAAAIWNPDFATSYDSKLSRGALIVAARRSSEDQSDSLDFFSVQVATFRSMENAEGLYHELISRGYPAVRDYPRSTEEGRYLVLAGEFDSRADALSLAKELEEQVQLSCMVVRRRADQAPSGTVSAR